MRGALFFLVLALTRGAALPGVHSRSAQSLGLIGPCLITAASCAKLDFDDEAGFLLLQLDHAFAWMCADI